MKRMDPSFSEKSLGFKSFSDFLRSRSDIVELDESSTTRLVRLRGIDARSFAITIQKSGRWRSLLNIM